MATKALTPYVLPIKGLSTGTHTYSFQVDETFFRAFEASPVEYANVEVALVLDKKPRILVLDFDLAGTVQTECDRCLTTIQLPISGQHQLIVKYGEATNDSEDEDVVYISPDLSSWSVAQFVYEYILLALPLIKVYDCENDTPPPCDEQMLDKLEGAEDEQDNQPSNPFRDAFKDWNTNQ